jgi:predicted MPP superfamily phosphohydrolase
MPRIALFISIYLLVYGGLHLYLYRRLRRAFALSRGERRAVLALLLLMVCGPLLSRGLEGLGWPGLTQLVAVLVYSWMGWLFLAASLFFLIDLLRLVGWLLQRVAYLTLPVMPWRPLFVVVVMLSVAASLYGTYAAREIRVERVVLPTSKLPVGIERYRLVQLSDVHLGVMSRAAWVQRMVTVVNDLQPDLIVTTGDIIDSNISSALPFQRQLAMLQAPDGKYSVAGNHEFFAGIDKAVVYMRVAGFVMLRGERAEVRPWLQLLGVDDREGLQIGGAQMDREPSLMATSDPAAITILLKHQPVVRQDSIGRFDLELAGHVHQGQIFPFRLLTWLVYPIAMGLSDLGQGSQIYVTRGVGTWGPSMRLLAPPEITVLEFVRKG